MFLVAGNPGQKRVNADENVVVDSAETDSQGVVLLRVTESKMFLLARYKNQGVHLTLQPKDSAGRTL